MELLDLRAILTFEGSAILQNINVTLPTIQFTRMQLYSFHHQYTRTPISPHLHSLHCVAFICVCVGHIYVHEGMRTCMCRCLCTCVYTCEVIVGYLSPLFPTSCYETGSYTGPGAHQRSRPIALCVLGTSILYRDYGWARCGLALYMEAGPQVQIFLLVRQVFDQLSRLPRPCLSQLVTHHLFIS